MGKAEVMDVVEELKRVWEELDSIKNSEDEMIRKREFELFMDESKLVRKINKELNELNDDVRNRFFIKRITDLVGSRLN